MRRAGSWHGLVRMNDLQTLLESSGKQAEEERCSAEYSLTAAEDGHLLEIQVPGLESMKGVAPGM